MTMPRRAAPALPPRVLFFTDNGLGLGHMTRLLAVAQKADARFKPVGLTLSLAYPLLRDAGLPAEHFPSYSHLGITKMEWGGLLTDRILEAVAWTGAGVVVVDHVSPPHTFRDLREEAPDLHLIWSRRGLWRAGKNRDALLESEAFQTIVEPGDVASAIDVGLTATSRERVVSVNPIVLVGREDYLPRSEARRHLGLPEDGRAFLLQLGEETPEALRSAIERTRDTIRSAVGKESVHLFTPIHPLQAGSMGEIEGVAMLAVYPVARFFEAFDGVVSTAGYNSFHEIVVSGLPAVFLASDRRIDDQHRRARFAEWSGRAFCAEGLSSVEFTDAVAKMVRPVEPAIAVATSKELGPMDGARQFADFIAELAGASRPPSPRLYGSDAVTCTVDALPAWLDQLQLRSSDTLVMSLTRIGSQDADRATALVRSKPYQTVVLVGDDHRVSGIPFESLMTVSEWESIDAETPFEQYRTSRIGRMASRYSAAAVIDLEPARPRSH